MTTRLAPCTIAVHGPARAKEGLLRLAPLLHDGFLLCADAPGAVRLTPDEAFGLVRPEAGAIRVSTGRGAAIAAKTGLRADGVHLLAALLGLVQWRALQSNPLLVAEDFLHAVPPECLYAQIGLSCSPSAFMRPGICPACADFYACLGAEQELVALQRLLAALRQPLRN